MNNPQYQRFEYFLGLIDQWHKRHRDIAPGTTTKIRKRFEKYAFDYAKLFAEYRNTGKKSLLDKANDVLETAEKDFKLLKKLELLGTLSK